RSTHGARCFKKRAARVLASKLARASTRLAPPRRPGVNFSLLSRAVLVVGCTLALVAGGACSSKGGDDNAPGKGEQAKGKKGKGKGKKGGKGKRKGGKGKGKAG